MTPVDVAPYDRSVSSNVDSFILRAVSLSLSVVLDSSVFMLWRLAKHTYFKEHA